jgi:hypothetical protein
MTRIDCSLRRFRHIILVVFSVLYLAVPGIALGQPGWQKVYAPPIAPAQARNVLSSTTAAAAAVNSGAATALSTDVVEMARALQNDPLLMYEFVRNHIEYVPYFGSLKGATLTLLDRSGNDFDQASLLIAMLRAAGFTAEYGYGTMTIPNEGTDGYGMYAWFGVEPYWFTLHQVLGQGGIPGGVSGATTQMDRVWVRVTVDGATYPLDPAFKPSAHIPGIDLSSAMGYDRDSLLAAAGGEEGDHFVRNLSESVLRDQLSGYTTTLVDYIRAAHTNAQVAEIIGGRTIVAEYLDTYPASLRFPVQNVQYWQVIPLNISIRYAFKTAPSTGRFPLLKSAPRSSL